jgi:hypothetical protein
LGRLYHIDLYADDQALEVTRLIALGRRWCIADDDILADPDGNRFCVVDASRCHHEQGHTTNRREFVATLAGAFLAARVPRQLAVCMPLGR